MSGSYIVAFQLNRRAIVTNPGGLQLTHGVIRATFNLGLIRNRRIVPIKIAVQTRNYTRAIKG